MQIAQKHHGVRTIVEHIGSAQDGTGLASQVQMAREKIHAGRQAFDLDWLTPGSPVTAAPIAVGSSSRVLWEVLEDTYQALGFDTVGDEVFRSRVLTEPGVPAPSSRTIWRTLARSIERGWRDKVSRAAYAHATNTGGLSLVLYDVTTLYFEVEDEDELGTVAMSNERRVDPQIIVGLQVTPDGFALEVHAFTGNTAETTTLIPVLRSFQDRHGVKDIVVAADAGMLSAGTRERPVVYHYSAKRGRRDNHTLDKQVERAQKIVDGTRPVKKDRVVKLTGTRRGIDQGLVDRARHVAGLRDTSPPSPRSASMATALSPRITSYSTSNGPSRWRRPTCVRGRCSTISTTRSGRLTIVITALAIARHLQDVTGVSIRKLVRTLRTVRDVTIHIAANEIIAITPPSPEATAILPSITR